MELSQVESQRRGLLQVLILVIMVFLAVISLVSYRQNPGFTIPVLSVLALGACLHVIAKERSLKKQHVRLLRSLVEREGQVMALDLELQAEQIERQHHQGQVTALDSRLRELTGLYRAISTVNAVRDPEQTVATVLDAALELVDCDSGSIELVQGGQLVVQRTAGVGSLETVGAARPIENGPGGWVIENCEPLLLNDDEHLEFVGATPFTLFVPLTMRGRVQGVLNLGASDQSLNDTHLRFAAIFAQHATMAIENAQLLRNSARHELAATS